MRAGGLSLAELVAAVSERSAGRLQASIEGDPAHFISGLAPLSTAGPADLSFLVNPLYRSDARTARAGAIALSPSERGALEAVNGTAFVIIKDAYAWFALAAQQLCGGQDPVLEGRVQVQDVEGARLRARVIGWGWSKGGGGRRAGGCCWVGGWLVRLGVSQR